MTAIETLARYEPDTVYIGTGEYVAECVRSDDGDYYLAADVDAVIEALRAEVERLHEALDDIRSRSVTDLVMRSDPAVQAEPVAYIRQEDFEFILADDKSEPYGTRQAPVFSRKDCRDPVPLYASPQPPAQARAIEEATCIRLKDSSNDTRDR